MDQSVMNFATSAARASAIPTPTEGMTSYRTDLDQLESYDGAEWRVTNGMALLSTTTLSGATTTVSGINQNYADLEIWVYGMTNATASGGFLCAPNGATTLVQATGTWNSAGSMSLSGINNERIYSANSLDRAVSNNAMKIRIEKYASTTNYKTFNATYTFINPMSGSVSENFSGGIKTNNALTSFVFSNNGGNWSTGTVEIWGCN
jgi:hypothetical protein